jgi:hypothetical protein
MHLFNIAAEHAFLVYYSVSLVFVLVVALG